MSKKKALINQARTYQEPIGPATALIDPTRFLSHANAALERSHETVTRLQEMLENSGWKDTVLERCRFVFFSRPLSWLR